MRFPRIRRPEHGDIQFGAARSFDITADLSHYLAYLAASCFNPHYLAFIRKIDGRFEVDLAADSGDSNRLSFACGQRILPGTAGGIQFHGGRSVVARASSDKFFAAYAKKDFNSFMQLWSAKSPEIDSRRKAMQEISGTYGKIELINLSVRDVAIDGEKARFAS